jgi:hypothetical protein
VKPQGWLGSLTATAFDAEIQGRNYTIVLAERSRMMRNFGWFPQQSGFECWDFPNKAGIHIRSSEVYSDEKGSLVKDGHGVNAIGAVGDWDSVCYQSYNGPRINLGEYTQAGWRAKLTEFENFSESSTKFKIVCAFQQYEGDHFFVFLPPTSNLDDIDRILKESGEVASGGSWGRFAAYILRSCTRQGTE